MDERGKTGTAGPLGMAVREGLPGWVYMLLTAFLWSTGGILIKLIPGNAIAINGARCLIALIFFSLYTEELENTDQPDGGGRRFLPDDDEYPVCRVK